MIQPIYLYGSEVLREVAAPADLSKKEELGLRMLEKSARGEGYHLVFVRRPDMSNEENLEWASSLLEVEFDSGAKDITRVFFTTTANPEDLLFLKDEIFEISEVKETVKASSKKKKQSASQSAGGQTDHSHDQVAEPASLAAFDLCAEQAGLNPHSMDVWGERNWHSNLMAVLSVGVAKLMSQGQLRAVVAQRLPNYSDTEDCQKLIDYFYDNYDAGKGFMNASLREINARAQNNIDTNSLLEDADADDA